MPPWTGPEPVAGVEPRGPGEWTLMVTCANGPRPAAVPLTIEASDSWDLWKPSEIAVNGTSAAGSRINVRDGEQFVVEVGCPVGASTSEGRVVLWAFSGDFEQLHSFPFVSIEHPATESRPDGFTSSVTINAADRTAPPHYAIYFVGGLCEATQPGFDPGPDAVDTDELIAIVPLG